MALTSSSERDAFFLELKRAPRKITKLQLDWPSSLNIGRLMDLLLELGDSLEEKGLVIAAPCTHLPKSHTSEKLLQQFYAYNTIHLMWCPSMLREILIKRQMDADALMSKLDWRIPESTYAAT